MSNSKQNFVKSFALAVAFAMTISFSLPGDLYALTVKEEERVVDSSQELLARIHLEPGDPLLPTMEFFRGVLRAAGNRVGALAQAHHGFIQTRYDLVGRESLGRKDTAFPVGIELLAFLDRVAREWLLPRSPVEISFPEEPEFCAPYPRVAREKAESYRRAVQGLCFDPLVSLPYGGWRWGPSCSSCSPPSSFWRRATSAAPPTRSWWSTVRPEEDERPARSTAAACWCGP